MYHHIRSLKFQVSAAALGLATIAALTFALEFARPVQAYNPPGVPGPGGAALNVCVLNRPLITQLANINVASTIRLQRLGRDAQNEISNMQQNLQLEYHKLTADGQSLTDVNFLGKKASLDERARELAALVDTKRRQIEATRTEVNRQVSNAALPILQAVEKARSCSLLLPRETVLDSNGATDITGLVLEAMNARLRPVPFKLVEIRPLLPAH